MEIAVDGKLPFLRMLLRNSGTVLATEVYRKPADSDLLLHFRSHVGNRYKAGADPGRGESGSSHGQIFSTLEYFALTF